MLLRSVSEQQIISDAHNWPAKLNQLISNAGEVDWSTFGEEGDGH